MYVKMVMVLAATVTFPLVGAVRLADPFADGMVLQRDRPVPVWGMAAPGEKVTVTFAGERVAAVAGTDGKWMCRLPPLKMSKESREDEDGKWRSHRIPRAHRRPIAPGSQGGWGAETNQAALLPFAALARHRLQRGEPASWRISCRVNIQILVCDGERRIML